MNRTKLIKDYAQRCADSMDVDALVEFVQVTIASNMAKMTDEQVTEEIRDSFPGMLRTEPTDIEYASRLFHTIHWIPEVDGVGPYQDAGGTISTEPRRIVYEGEVVTINRDGGVIGRESLEEGQAFHDKSTGKIYAVLADGTLNHMNKHMEDVGCQT